MGIENRQEKTPQAAVSLDLIKESFPGGVLETSLPQGDAVAVVRPEQLAQVMTFLRDDCRLLFNVLVDITAVDHMARDPRFDVVYHLLSIAFNRRIRIKVRVGEDQSTVDTVSHLWSSANWLEREVWDMFGIRFKGHPDLRRILLYDEFEGHPLRKDYPIRKRQPRIGPKN
jgi:NADH-quinone oxidoreductase subunit C